MRYFSKKIRRHRKKIPTASFKTYFLYCLIHKNRFEIPKHKHQEPIINEINDSIKELKKAVDNSIDDFRSSTDLGKKAHLWVLAALFIGGLVSIFISFKLCVPNAYFTSSQVATYKNGTLLELFWDKLSKKEQTKLIAVANGKLPSEENSIEWIREHNPGISNLDVIKRFNMQP